MKNTGLTTKRIGILGALVVLILLMIICITNCGKRAENMPAPETAETTPAQTQSQPAKQETAAATTAATTVPTEETTVPTEEMENWLKTMNELPDIKLCIVSNSHNDRVPKFCRERGIDVITHAKKPFPKGINECLNRYGIPASQAALIGDQIYTDTLGANNAGVLPILVEAIHNHNFWLKARHVLEMPFIFIARNRRI